MFSTAEQLKVGSTLKYRSSRSSSSAGNAASQLPARHTVTNDFAGYRVDQAVSIAGSSSSVSTGLKGKMQSALTKVQNSVKIDLSLGRLFEQNNPSSKDQVDGALKIFTEIDIDGSNSVTFNEFSKWLTAWAEGSLSQKREATGQPRDSVGLSSSLDRQELNRSCHTAFSKLDRDGMCVCMCVCVCVVCVTLSYRRCDR
jgi:hypothetical protein